MNTVSLVINPAGNYHVSQEAIWEFEAAILSDPRVARLTMPPFRKSALLRIVDDRFRYLPSRLLADVAGDNLFVVLMGANFRMCMPHFSYPRKKSLYMFDAWPQSHETIKEFISTWSISHVFVSSSQATERLSKIEDRCQFHWIPEGVDVDVYKHYPYESKNIDVLQFGRKYDLYHDFVVGSLNAKQNVYLYEKRKGEIVFPTREEFIEGLARTKISICFPSSTTHPERAGDIETMTTRYLQSMASKCLIVGKAPQEMIRLFGYNPVVEADLNHATSQLESILHTFNDFIPIIEKNFAAVRDHTWYRRWQQVSDIILS